MANVADENGMDARLPESVSRSVLRLRAIGYFIAVPALAIAWWVDRTPELGTLAAAGALAVIWNIVRLPKAGATWALGIDLAGTALIWWMFGPVPPVYFLLAYVVVVSAIVLDRTRALRTIGATVALILGMGVTHMFASGEALPLFHGSTEAWVDRLGEFGLPLAIVLYTAVIMLSISRTLDASRASLATSEQQFRLSFDGAATGMVSFQLEGNLTRANRAFCEQTGYTEQELLNMSWRDLVTKPDQVAAEHQLRSALDGGPAHWRVQHRLVRFDGSMFWAGIVVTLIRDEDGSPYAYFAQTRDISEQKAAEAAVAASEERYRSLFEGIPAALYRTSPEGQILDANPALVELLGYPDRETMLKIDVHDAYVNKGQRGDLVNFLETEGRTIDFEEQLRRYDGSEIWVRDSSRIVHDDNGGIAYFEGALVDTTARHHAEEALTESEAHLRAIFEHAPIGIVAINLDWQIVTANVALSRMLGRSLDELKGTYLHQLSHADDIMLDDELSEQLLAGEIPSYQFSKRYIHADGHTIWTEVYVTAVLDDHGVPELMIGLIQDITERHTAQAGREQMIKILEATPDLVAILDVEGHPTYANLAAREFFNLTAEEHVSHLNIAELIHTDSGDTVGDIFLALRNSGWWQGYVTLRSPDGELLPGSAVVIAHTDANGMITHISTTFRDLTERIETERRLERLVRSKDEFVASVSHELRTPLTVVVGLTQELKASWKAFSTGEINEFLGLVANQASDVANLVEDLLVAARADIGKVSVVPKAVELAGQIDGVVGALNEVSQRRITVGVDPIEMWADPARLRQVIRNLITNAVRYGGRHIEVGATCADGFVALHVSDDGPGISPGLEERIFEPYARDHEPGSQPNSVGLGLTVSRHLARLMGGDLVYTRGERSTFTLTLPVPASSPAHVS